MTNTPATITISINRVEEGDIISLPKPPEAYSDNRPGTYQPGEQIRVVRTWWHTGTQRHMIQIGEEHSRAILAFSSTTDVTLHQRPGFGPFDATYQVGSKVLVRWMGFNSPGLIVEALHDGGDSAYTVRTHRGLAYVGPENMAIDHSPLPAEGQQWVCLHGRHKGMVLTVLKPDGIQATCQRSTTKKIDTYILMAANYGLTVDTAPEPTGVQGVDYVDVEMEAAGTMRMVRVFR